MAKNYIERYIWLIDTLSSYGPMSLSEISERWQRSSLNDAHAPLAERTFHNHRQAIADVFGIDIEHDRSRGYTIGTCEGQPGGELRRWLMESISLSRIVSDASAMRDRILLERIPSSYRWLSMLVESIRSAQCVEITHQGFHRAAPATLAVHPYGLKLFRRRWYLLARPAEASAPRTYSLDRIHRIVILPQPSAVPVDFSVAQFFAHHFGIVTGTGEPVEDVELRVTNREAQYLDTLPLHHSQFKVEANDTYTTYRYRLAPTYDFRMELLSRGAAVEVLQPEWFRAEVKQHIEAMMQNYE
ncbi:MAG: WYL domain-containing protein [Bacteroidales bacterium]|nr:WYL domain-containing protein [Bacteroidales bacterium]